MRRAHRLRLILFLAAFALFVSSSTSETTPQSTNEGAHMKEFAFIFRQTPHPLTPEQQKRRAEEVRDWAVRLRDEGHKLNPYILASKSEVIPPDSAASANDSVPVEAPVIALLLIDFPSVEEAKKAAQSHPGLHYGVSIEVREATAPAPVSPVPQTPPGR
jgi:hypothetical protein